MDFQRPPSDINPNLNTVYERIALSKVVKGDHFRNYDAGIHDSIAVCPPSNGCQEVVTVISEGDKLIPTHQVIDVDDTEVEILKYPCNGNSSTWVKKALKLSDSKQPLKDVTHPSAFIMRCKIGHDIEWDTSTISQLVMGDQIIANHGYHSIVERTSLRQTKIWYLTWLDGSIVRKEWKGFDSRKPILRAVYNTCCTDSDALSCANRLSELTGAGSKFKDSEEFAKFCKSGYTALDQPTQKDESEIIYPPKVRHYNREVITRWDDKPVSDILRGDHVFSEKGDIPHSLVEKRVGNTLHVICCIEENGKTEIKQTTMQLKSASSTIQVARYESSQDSGSAVRKAISLLGTKRADEFKDNPADFVMLCKRGDYIEWKTCFINQLVRGDHIKWGFSDRNHGIVKYVNPSKGRVMVYMYKYRGVKNVLITRESQFQRAVYNSCYNPDTVLKLMESRVGESQYHPFDNDDFYLARWCKTGKLKARTATKELVLSADMLQPGDQVSWTRWATYDHHALVIKVLGPNEIEVFEFTTRSGDKTNGKTYKKRTRLPIFDGSDPVYKVTHTPAEDPQILLKEAERQEGEIGGYHPLSNNCENFAGSNKGYASQALAFFHWLKTLLLNMSAKTLTSQLAGIFDDVIKAVVEFSATAVAGVGGDAVVAYGLKILANSLHVIGFFIPFGIELLLILWDINHDWADHQKTRIITGIVGTALTSIGMSLIALIPASIPISICLAIAAIGVGIFGFSMTAFVRRLIRRKIDQNKCKEAFKGMYEEKPSQVMQFADDMVQKMEENMAQLDKTISNMASELSQASLSG